MISAKRLVKWYGPTAAVSDLTFDIEPGQIVGFLGPNGAGKSTTMRILTGYLPPTSGSASIGGHDVLDDSRAARAQIGYLPEGTPLYGEMRVTEYLDYRGRLLKMPRAERRRRIDEVCGRCGLEPVRRRAISNLSRGNKQRVGLAQALLHEPPVLILDEPTAGLDPKQITAVRGLIAELRGRHTVLLSSHILPEVEKTADRVMIIAGGRLVADGSPDELRRRVAAGGRVLIEAKAGAAALREAVGGLDAVARVEVSAQDDGWTRATITPKDDADIREAIGGALLARGVALREIRLESASLEQFFVQVTDSVPGQASEAVAQGGAA